MPADKEPENSERSQADRIARFRWTKGKSGNPSGRPPLKAVLSDALRDRLAEQVPGDKRGRTYAQKIAARLVEAALRGSVSAAALIADRCEGRAPQPLTGARGEPLIPTDPNALLIQMTDLIAEIKSELKARETE